MFSNHFQYRELRHTQSSTQPTAPNTEDSTNIRSKTRHSMFSIDLCTIRKYTAAVGPAAARHYQRKTLSMLPFYYNTETNTATNTATNTETNTATNTKTNP